MSIIKLYKTSLSPNRNFLIEDFSTWLSSKATTLYSYNSGQFIKQDMTLTLKVPLDEFSVNKLSVNFVDYVSIKNIEEGTTTSTFYYYVVHSVWRGKTTIELTLVLDVLNTYKIGTDYSLSPRSFIKREHKDRFIQNSNVGYKTIRFNRATSSSSAEVLSILANDNFHRNFNDVEVVDDGTTFPVASISWTQPLNKGVDNYLSITLTPTGVVSAGDYQVKLKFYYSSLIRKIDLYSEDISAPLYKKEDKEILDNQDSNNYYLYYKNQLTIDPSEFTQVNPVDLYLATSQPIEVQINEDNMLNLGTLADGDYLIYQWNNYYQFKATSSINYTFIVDNGNASEIVYLHKAGGTTELIILDNSRGNDVHKIYKTTITSFELLSSKLEVECYFVSDITSIPKEKGAYVVPTYNSTLTFTPTTTTNVNTAVKDNIPKAQAESIKIIDLPYCPVQKEYDSINDRYLFNDLWDYDSTLKLLKSNEKNIKFYNQFAEDQNPLENIVFVNALSITDQDSRNDNFESKLYHSDYYRPHFYYDSFAKDFALEKIDTNAYLKTNDDRLVIEFIASTNLVSKFLFKFPQYLLENATEDFSNVLLVARNNEEALYTSAYVNYIRTGYNYDVKNKDRNMAANIGTTTLGIITSLASMGIGALTHNPFMVAGGAVGMVATISNSLVSVAKNTANAEANLEAKLKEAKLQGVSVNNVDDIDLLNAYANNKARFCNYIASEKLINQVADIFHYCGYVSNEFKVPNINSRIWWNYVEGDIVFSSFVNVDGAMKESIRNKFAEGITIFHHRTKGWDLEQEKENYENWLLEE